MSRRLPLIKSSTPLPPLYARWMDELLGAPTPPEVEATCEDCPMCRLPPPAERFEPSVRCCSYMPRLPNFLVGGILGDRRVPARESVGARVDAGEGVTPLGLDPTAMFSLVYDNARGAFGRVPGLRCPHYLAEGNGCGIWAYRNSVCATYFCLHVRGRTGNHFWEAARELLAAIEDELAHACLLDLGVDAASLDAMVGANRARPPSSEPLGRHAIEGRVDPAVYRRLWGSWAGKERALYRRCFELVGQMSWSDVARRCGPRVHARARIAKAAHDALVSTEMPSRLRLGRLRMEAHPTERGVRSISAEDGVRTVEADEEMFEALSRFRGQELAQTLEELRRDLGVKLDDESLRKLVDLGILVPA